MDPENACDFRDGSRRIAKVLRVSKLLIIELAWRPERYSARDGGGSSGARTFGNERAFESRDAGEDGHNHYSARAGRVGPRFGKGTKARFTGSQLLAYIQEVAG